MRGDPEIGCGLATGRPEPDVDCSLTISPGDGTAGSLSCKFIRTVDRRRPVWEKELEDLCGCSCWSPAFMVAAACSDMEAERGDLVDDSLRGIELSLSSGDAIMIVEVVGIGAVCFVIGRYFYRYNNLFVLDRFTCKK
jgi:hypothetical protein